MASEGPAESNRRRATAALLTAVLGPLAVSGILVAFRDEFFSTSAAVVLVLPVLGAAIVGGRRGGATSAVIAALCFDFFFTHPYYSFTIDNRDELETTIVLLIVGLVVGELVVRTRRSSQLAAASRREVNQVRRVAELAAASGPKGRLISIVEHELVELLGAESARFERRPYPTVLLRLGHGMVTLPSDDDSTDRKFGPSNELELPIWGQGREIGRLVLVLPHTSSAVGISADDRALAVTLVDQLGAVLAASSM
jgi:Domain of unknown function (DUF4118)